MNTVFKYALILAALTSGAKLVAQVDDDIYFSPKDIKPRQAVQQEQQQQQAPPATQPQDDYYNGKTQNSRQGRQQDNINYDDTRYSSRDFRYDDYYDYEYAARLRRFHSPYYNSGYYDPFYTNTYWYTGNPYHWGLSVYLGYNWWGPSYYTYSYTPGWYWGVSYGSPYYSSWGCGWGYPYYGYGSYMNGYSNGYWHGYYNGYYASHYNNYYYNSYDQNSTNNGTHYGPRRGLAGGSGTSGGGGSRGVIGGIAQSSASEPRQMSEIYQAAVSRGDVPSHVDQASMTHTQYQQNLNTRPNVSQPNVIDNRGNAIPSRSNETPDYGSPRHANMPDNSNSVPARPNNSGIEVIRPSSDRVKVYDNAPASQPVQPQQSQPEQRPNNSRPQNEQHPRESSTKVWEQPQRSNDTYQARPNNSSRTYSAPQPSSAPVYTPAPSAPTYSVPSSGGGGGRSGGSSGGGGRRH